MYKQKYYKDIFLKALNNALQQGLISHQQEFEKYIQNKQDISNFYVMLLSIHSEIFEQVYVDMTEVYYSPKVDYALNTDLDEVGAIVGISRPPATHSTVEVTFSLSRAQETDVHEPAGLILSSTVGISYKTAEELYIPAGETSTTISAIATVAGTGQTIVENQIKKVESETSTVETSLVVNNARSSTGGYDAFTDEQYRELIKNWQLVYEKGNYWAFYNYLSRFDGIDGFNFIPNWDGSGTIKIIVDPGTTYQLETMYDELQNTISQATEDIVLTAPDKVYINVYATVDVDIDQANPYSKTQKEEIQSKIISAIKLFIDGGKDIITGEYYKGLSIGEDFIPYKLGAFLNRQIPELMNITFKTPKDYIAISDEEIGTANEIKIEMM